MHNSPFIWNMQGIRKTTFETRTLLVALLAGLLLVAPCKVRNSIESSLGLTTTKISNKIKATASKSHCATYGATQMAQMETTSSTAPVSPFLPILLASVLVIKANRRENTMQWSALKAFALCIPLYILYLHFKVYL